MAKSLYIAEKPSVAREFAAALKIAGRAADGYIEEAEYGRLSGIQESV